MKALALSQPPERHAYQALVTVAECPPDDMPESHLPTDRAQFFPCGIQQLLPQLGLQLLPSYDIMPVCDILYHATSAEDSKAFIKQGRIPIRIRIRSRNSLLAIISRDMLSR